MPLTLSLVRLQASHVTFNATITGLLTSKLPQFIFGQ